MLRFVLAVIACVSLSACWMSEERFFGDGDWAHLDLNGNFAREDADGDRDARIVLKTRPNGIIDGTITELESGETEQAEMGLVPIEGGSGRYFLAVDRSDETTEGDIYLIGHLTDQGALVFYWPNCQGTPPTTGLTIQQDHLADEPFCNFSSRAALMKSALEAERFVAGKHIVAVVPMGRFVRDDGAEEIPE